MRHPDSKNSDRQRSSPGLNWVDLLVIVAASLTFVVVIVASNPAAKTSNRGTDHQAQMSQTTDDASLLRARIRLAQGGPWL